MLYVFNSRAIIPLENRLIWLTYVFKKSLNFFSLVSFRIWWANESFSVLASVLKEKILHFSARRTIYSKQCIWLFRLVFWAKKWKKFGDKQSKDRRPRYRFYSKIIHGTVVLTLNKFWRRNWFESTALELSNFSYHSATLSL